MKICFVSRRHFPAISGMSTYAQNLILQLVDMGHDVTVIAQYRESIENHYSDGPPVNYENVRTFGVEQIGEPSGDFESDIIQLKTKIIEAYEEQAFDIIHTQFAYPTGLAALNAAVHLQISSVLSIQGGDGHWFGTCCNSHLETYRFILNNTNAVVIGTSSFQNEVNTNVGMKTEMKILPGAVDPNIFVPSNPSTQTELKMKHGIDIGKKVVLYHGRIDRRKGLIELINAYALLCKEQDNTVLVLSGIGPDQDLVAEEIDRLGIVEEVKILGGCLYDEANVIYSIADIFVSPTYGEGFSNTLAEAMSCELPIITTRAPGVQDVLENDTDCLLVGVNEVEELAAAMQRLLNDLQFAKNLGINARKKVLEKYNWEVLAEGYTKIYETAITTFDNYEVSEEDGENFQIDDCRFREKPHLL